MKKCPSCQKSSPENVSQCQHCNFSGAPFASHDSVTDEVNKILENT